MDGAATRSTTIVGTNATAAPIRHAAQTIIAQDHVITRRAMGMAATTVLQTVPQGSIVAAAAEPAQDRARAAQTSQTIQHILDRAPSIQTTADGDATRATTTKTASASAAPIVGVV